MNGFDEWWKMHQDDTLLMVPREVRSYIWESAQAQEREACAKIAEDENSVMHSWELTPACPLIAAAIRERGMG